VEFQLKAMSIMHALTFGVGNTTLWSYKLSTSILLSLLLWETHQQEV